MRNNFNMLRLGFTITPAMIAFGCGSGNVTGEINKPNIILCMADDQGWGDMGFNGHPVIKTPNFDKFATEGLRFDHFYAAAPLCSPTRGSILTGRHPNRFGCFSFGQTIRPQEVTIAEALKSAGYTTGHFGKWHLGSVREGSPVNPGNSGFDSWISSPNYFDNDPILSVQGKALQFHGESSMVTVDAALDFIRENAKSKKPFLAIVWFGSPHNPHMADQIDIEQYPGLQANLQNYYGEITGMDRAFGKLREQLREIGIAENTLLWYCSDNGGQSEKYSRTGGRGQKNQIYEGGLRVPAVMEWPSRFKGNRIITFPCNTVDIYPTLLKITGVKVKDQPVLDGMSLLPVLDGKIQERNKPIGFWHLVDPGRIVPTAKLMSDLLDEQSGKKTLNDSSLLELNAGDITMIYNEENMAGHSAWLQWPYKLHRIRGENGNIRYELYDLEKDPLEKNDIVNIDTSKTETMKSGLDHWLESVLNSLNGKDYDQ